jgi:pilus assembly protein Flp/PilA
MNHLLFKMYAKSLELKNNQEGQDMVEYALVVALISLAATVTMQGVATGVANHFTAISNAIG